MTDINDAGDVAGIVERPDGDAIIVWHADDPEQPELRGLPGNGIGMRATVGEDGTVVALYHDADQLPSRGFSFAWGADSAGRPLAPPAGTEGGQVSAIQGPWAVGSAFVTDRGPAERLPVHAVPELSILLPTEGTRRPASPRPGPRSR